MIAKKSEARDCDPIPFEATSKHNINLGSIADKLGHAAWVTAYSVEEARQRYADRRQLVRQAGACILLVVLRLAGVRYV